ncbi:MAG TPA: hypothetical protein PLF32_07915 [Bacteroidales bacterium]|nr:hypothetical protein [Bacteroidales bacterium]HON20211.1 hypothetical protein [Bacteroidales bacterium]HOR82566.1 hypothetical protein [Bacteroidales bacterium]HPJ90988.1 hypothetical protein [Bacteroidales bacterium]
MRKICIILFAVIVFSCKMITPSQFAKVKYGNIPYYANTLIVTEQDTLWAVFHHPKKYGSFKQKYNGRFYHITKGNEHRLLFSCDIKDGKLCGDTYAYYGSGELLKLGYLKNGYLYGFYIFYFSNGNISEIGCYCNEKMILYSYNKKDTVTKLNDICDSCRINEYILANIPDSIKQGIFK